jgi:maleamate amidohydrolase
MRTGLTIEPGRTAVLFIDLQEEHRQDQRFLVEGFDRVVANAAQLQAAARRSGMALFHWAYVVDLDRTRRPFHPVLADGTSAFSDKGDPRTAICAEVAPAAGEASFVKAEASAFGPDEPERSLKSRGIEWLIVAGVWTEACVDATVKDALRRGFRVLLVKDACGSGTQAMHETALLNLANRLYGGAVVDTSAACRLIEGLAAEAWQPQSPVPLRFTYDNATALYRDL